MAVTILPYPGGWLPNYQPSSLPGLGMEKAGTC